MAASCDQRFGLLAAGAALVAAGLALLSWHGVAIGIVAYMLTPLFGFPVLAVEARRRSAWPLYLYFLILLPIFHYLATVAAIKAVSPDLGLGLFVAGLAGGAVGSGLSLLPLALVSRQRRREALVMGGIALLTLLGGAGLWAGETVSARVRGEFALIPLLFLPWQIAFAWFLSRLLAPPPPAASADACDAAHGAP